MKIKKLSNFDSFKRCQVTPFGRYKEKWKLEAMNLGAIELERKQIDNISNSVKTMPVLKSIKISWTRRHYDLKPGFTENLGAVG